MFDGTDQDFVKHRAREEINDPKLGTVVQVYEHLNQDDNSNFECDVFVDGNLFEERAIPYLGLNSTQISPPTVGDTVLVVFRAGENSRPILLGTAYTNKDRAPLARAGMYRDVYKAGYSPTTGGNIKVTGYTKYSDNPAIKDVSSLSVEETFYQISKDSQSPNPSASGEAPMLIEMYDSPSYAEDASRISLEGNVVDGDDTKSMNMKLDFKEGTTTTEAVNEQTGMSTSVEHDVKNDILDIVANDGTSDYSVGFDPSVPKITIDTTGTSDAGLSLNFNTGEFTILDGSGYGIESDGNGNFTWHHESIDMSEGTTTTL